MKYQNCSKPLIWVSFSPHYIFLFLPTHAHTHDYIDKMHTFWQLISDQDPIYNQWLILI